MPRHPPQVEKKRPLSIRAWGTTFRFAYDPEAPELLHIFARHMTTTADAVGIFFDPNAEQEYNEGFERFERRTATHELYWFWIDKDRQLVMVISCFKRKTP